MRGTAWEQRLSPTLCLERHYVSAVIRRNPLLVFEAPYDAPLHFAQSWAESIMRQVKVVRESRVQHDLLLWQAEKNEDWSPDDAEIDRQFGKLWTEQVSLVWMSFQLERWIARVYRDRGYDAPEPVAGLRDLRNALEHLDEAEFRDSEAVVDADGRSRSLTRLPGAAIFIGTSSSEQLFDLISASDLEKVAADLIGQLIDEMDDYAQDLWQQMLDDERRGK